MLLALISWELTAAIGSVLVLISLTLQILNRYAKRYGQLAVEAEQSLSDKFIETLRSMRTIVAFGNEASEQKRFEESSDQVRSAHLRAEILTGTVRPLGELLYVPVFLSAVVFTRGFGIPTTTLLVFLLILYRAQPYLRGIDHNRAKLAALSPSVQLVATLTGSFSAAETRETAVTEFRTLSFEAVTFAYPDTDAPALSDATFSISKGETIALVGPSGSGKTTLINLIYGFISPNQGRLLVDGVPLHELSLKGWRRSLAIAGQDIDLLDASIYDNVAYGNPDTSAEDIRRWIKAVGAAEFVDELPGGH